MSTTIEETIRTALTSSGYGSYTAYARPVVEALTERERELSDKLLDYATDLGADGAEVRTRLTELGMEVSPVEPELDDDDEGGDSSAMDRIEQKLTALIGTVDGLSEFARANGYRG